MNLSPKSIDIAVAVSVGVVISVYKLAPLLKEITEKERQQIEERRKRIHSSQNG